MTLQELLGLLNASPLHRAFTIAEVVDWLLPPIELQQYAGIRDTTSGKFIGFVCWAFVDDAAHQALLRGDRPLTAREWNSGPYIWVTEFIAPYGHAFKIARALKHMAEAQGLAGRPVHFVRRYVRKGRKPLTAADVGSWPSHLSQ